MTLSYNIQECHHRSACNSKKKKKRGGKNPQQSSLEEWIKSQMMKYNTIVKGMRARSMCINVKISKKHTRDVYNTKDLYRC